MVEKLLQRASYNDAKSELLQLVLNYYCHYDYALTFISIVWSFDSQYLEQTKTWTMFPSFKYCAHTLYCIVPGLLCHNAD